MISSPSTPASSTSRRTKRRPGVRPRVSREGVGVWTTPEHERFLEAQRMYPKGPWKLVAQFVGTRSTRQTMTHAQKCRQKVERRQRGLRGHRRVPTTTTITNTPSPKPATSSDHTTTTVTVTDARRQQPPPIKAPAVPTTAADCGVLPFEGDELRFQDLLLDGALALDCSVRVAEEPALLQRLAVSWLPAWGEPLEPLEPFGAKLAADAAAFDLPGIDDALDFIIRSV